MKQSFLMPLLAALFVISTAVWAQTTDKQQLLAFHQLAARTDTKMMISSPAFQNGQKIPPDHSAYNRNISIPLGWSRGPEGTQSYAVLIEDPDAPTPAPVVHWLLWNIPVNVTSLPADFQPANTNSGIAQGMNQSGAVGYYGPRPPANDSAHHYHIQLFAVDRMINLLPGSNREALVAALKGHVLAKTELQGLYAASDNPK